MRTSLSVVFGSILAALAGLASSAQAQTASAPKVEASLVSYERSIVPGKPFQVAIKQVIAKNWHTYWKNPGDSGLPTTVTWTLPEGFTASKILWPIPHEIRVGPLMNYGYEEKVLLPVQITPPGTIDTPSVTLKGKAEWLVCETICIPESAEIKLVLPVAPAGSEGLPSRHKKDFDATARAIPGAPSWQVKALLGKDKLALRLDAPSLKSDQIESITFFPDASGMIDHAGTQPVSWALGGPQLTAKLAPDDLGDGPLKRVSGVLVITENRDDKTIRNGFTVSTDTVPATAADFEYATPPNKAEVAHDADATAPRGSMVLLTALLFAFLGGMILNLMPCVLPILSLKAVSLASHNDGTSAAQLRASAKASSLWYLAGVMASFAALAIVLIALKSVGAAVGWGFQFQSPLFVLVMAGLFFLLGLSLSGVFDIGVGLEGTGASMTSQSGPRGSFFTGGLATLAATPCTAPFMGAALGYALSRPAFELFAVVMALGLGFALPMVALGISGAFAKLLPKPGPWMETLKQVLAFPLYATVGWLVWVLSEQTGSNGVLAAATLLIALGFGAWFIGRAATSLAVRATVAAVIAALALAISVPMLNTDRAIAKKRSTMTTDMAALDQIAFSPQRLVELRAQGRPVFVNFTAAWCITCKFNEQVALRSKRFLDAMKAKNVAYLKGDWTLQDPEITRVLQSFGRSGVPLYLLYPPGENKKPVVLPQLLTQGIVLGHINALPDGASNSSTAATGH